MSKVIIDIETIGDNFDELDEKSQKYLLKYAESKEEEEEIKQGLSLYPLTGQIVTIGMLNPDTDQGQLLYQNNGGEKEIIDENGFKYESGSEKEILEKFWQYVANYNQVITFNGRGFDGPFLHLRSAILKVKPTKNMVPYRYDYKLHCDLLDQLTFYGSTRRFSLDFYTKKFGIKSPKESGIDGLMVPDLYNKGEFKKIADYCRGDLVATKELFVYWDEFVKI